MKIRQLFKFISDFCFRTKYRQLLCLKTRGPARVGTYSRFQWFSAHDFSSAAKVKLDSYYQFTRFAPCPNNDYICDQKFLLLISRNCFATRSIRSFQILVFHSREIFFATRSILIFRSRENILGKLFLYSFDSKLSNSNFSFQGEHSREFRIILIMNYLPKRSIAQIAVIGFSISSNFYTRVIL